MLEIAAHQRTTARVPSALVTSECFAEAAIESRPHPRLPPERALTAETRTLEMRLYWGQQVLDLRHYDATRVVTIGESKRSDVFLSSEELPSDVFPLVRNDAGETILCFTDTMTGEVEMAGRTGSLRDWQLARASRDLDFHDTFNLPLSVDARVVIHHAGMTFALRFVPAAQKPTSGWLDVLDGSFTNVFLGVGLLHLVILATLAVYPHGATTFGDDEHHRPVVVVELDRLGLMAPPPQLNKPKPTPPVRRNSQARTQQGTRARTVRTRTSGARSFSPSFDRLFGGHNLVVGSQHQSLSSELATMIGSVSAEPTTLGISARSNTPGLTGVRPGPYDGLERDGLVRIGGMLNATRAAPPKLGGLGRRVNRGVEVDFDVPTVRDPLDRNQIQTVVQNHRAQVRYCYERELQRDNDLEGRVELRWTINARGNVSDVRVKSSTIKSPAVEQCLASRIKTWRFPTPAGGGVVEVNYPFVFRATP